MHLILLWAAVLQNSNIQTARGLVITTLPTSEQKYWIAKLLENWFYSGNYSLVAFDANEPNSIFHTLTFALCCTHKKVSISECVRFFLHRKTSNKLFFEDDKWNILCLEVFFPTLFSFLVFQIDKNNTVKISFFSWIALFPKFLTVF